MKLTRMQTLQKVIRYEAQHFLVTVHWKRFPENWKFEAQPGVSVFYLFYKRQFKKKSKGSADSQDSEQANM